MKIEIRQTISNTLDENRKLIRTSTVESTVIYPADGKLIKNIKTGKVYSGYLCLSAKEKVSDFIEIDR